MTKVYDGNIMKVLVIGGSGYVGSNVVRLITADKVTYFSRSKHPELAKLGFEWIQGDITDEEKVKSSVKDYDMIVDAAGAEFPADVAFSVNVNGIKNIANALNKNDTGQRLVYLSAINVHYGTTDFFRTKRTGEDNAALVKNHLNVRPSLIFGNGDPFTEKLIKLVKENNFGKLPSGGSLSPVHIADVVKVIEEAKDIRGSVDICSRDKVSFADLINMGLELTGKNKKGVITGRFGYKGAVQKLKDASVFTPEEVDKYLIDYYRENTYLDRFIKTPIKFGDYLKERISKA